MPLSQLRSTFPVLKNLANRHKAVGFTHEQWHYAFTNTFTEESRALYERYHFPAAAAVLWGSALANIHPGCDDTYVNYSNDARAPLLFIAGAEDHLMPPSVQRSNAKHYTSNTSQRSRSTRVARTSKPLVKWISDPDASNTNGSRPSATSRHRPRRGEPVALCGRHR